MSDEPKHLYFDTEEAKMTHYHQLADIRYFYFRDDRRRPVITLCRVINENGLVGYGWAICGPKDNPHKENILVRDRTTRQWIEVRGGRSIALGRAVAALRRGMPSPCAANVRVYDRKVHRQVARSVAIECQAMGFVALAALGDPWQLPKSMQPPSVEVPKDAA